MTSKKTGSKPPQKGEVDDQSSTIINNYYLNDCSSFQIGAANQQFIALDVGVPLLEQGRHETSAKECTNEKIIVAMLNNILHVEQTPVLLQKLEDCFLEHYKKIKSRSFKQISGLNLLPFLKKMPEKFKLILRNSNWLVDVVKHSAVTFPPSSSTTLSQQSPEEHVTAHCNGSGTSATARPTEEDSTGRSVEGNEWTVVNRKQSKWKPVPVPVVQTIRNETKKIPRGGKPTYAGAVANAFPKSIPICVKKLVQQAAKWSPTSIHAVTESKIPASPFQKLGPEANAEELQSNFISFMKEVDFFKKGHFALLTGCLAEEALAKSVGVLVPVPWILVFDLDEESRDRGLLARVEDVLKKTRSLNICTWRDKVKISEKATTWHFIRGNRASPGSRFEEGYGGWWKQILPALTAVAEDIAKCVQDTTILKVIVMWDDHNAAYLNFLVCKLNEIIQQSVMFIVCIDDQNSNTSTSAYTQLTHMKAQVDENIKVIPISSLNLFLGISDYLQRNAVSLKESMACTIPYADDSDDHINEHGYTWLSEYIVLIYMDADVSEAADVEIVEEHAQDFFKGGALKWDTRSFCGTEYIDVERDAMEKITYAIKKFILNFKSGLYTLHHAPGSGGSTLAQRVLWELRDTTPCIQIHFRSAASINDIANRLEYLHNHTHLPILALIDGEEERSVRQLMRSVRHVCLVVLYVKRHSYSMEGRENNSKTHWLQGQVTQRESRNLALKFGNFCKDEQKKALKVLSKDVKKGVHHHLYEFGLTAYLHEFTGIQSYVSGYLRVPRNTSDLLPWQKILGYLSLVYYYGQMSIPSQFFSHLLGKQSNYVVTIDDFPYEVKQFIVTDNSNGKKNELRICHYIVAKEILEQVLTKQTCPKADSNAYLSPKACQHLETFAISFISDASKRKVKTAVTSSSIAYILSRTFIVRDNKEVGEGESQTKRRTTMAKLLTDITSKPPYTERLRVLQKLTEAFPKDPNYHAHLGRFYSLCRPNEEEQAIKAFEKALTLCTEQIAGKNDADIDERLKVSLSHIYHMYGIIHARRLNSRTRADGTRPHTAATFDDVAADILTLAETACELFIKCREAKPPGYEDSFGYVGEITVRLRVCDFIHRRSTYKNLMDYISAEGHSEIGSQLCGFVEKSITAIDDLIMDCYFVVDPDDIDSSFTDAITWQHDLLGKLGHGLEALRSPCTENRRFKIAAKKLKYSNNGKYTTLDNINTAEDMKEVVDIYIEIFDEASNRGIEDKRALEIDFKQWMEAIRHDFYAMECTVEDVLVQVRRWHFLLKTPMSAFYLFVLTSMIGFGSSLGNGNPESLVEARNLKDELRKYGRWVTRSRYPREWLGNSENGIKQLMSNKAFVGNCEGKVTTVTSAIRKALVLCKGTIRKPNTGKVSGFIELDLGDNYVSVPVFFIPLRTDFEGPIHAGTRVEFHLGFSFFNGYEAFNVQALRKYDCSQCGSAVEIRSCETTKDCHNRKCGRKVSRNEAF